MRFTQFSMACLSVFAMLVSACGNNDQGYRDDYYGDQNSSYDAPYVVVVRYNQDGQAQYMTMNQQDQNMSEQQLRQLLDQQGGNWKTMSDDQSIDDSYPDRPNNKKMYFMNDPSRQKRPMSQGRSYEFGSANYWHNYSYDCDDDWGYYGYSNYCYNRRWRHVYPSYSGTWSGYFYQPTYYYWGNGGDWDNGYYYYRPWRNWSYGGWRYNCYTAWWY